MADRAPTPGRRNARRTFQATLSILWLLLAAMPAVSPAAVDYDTATRNFLTFVNSTKTIAATRALAAGTLAPETPAITVGYLSHLSGGGFVLMSASEHLTPVKAYSLTADFDSLPPPVHRFLLQEMEYHMRTLPDRTAVMPMSLSPEQQRWAFLLYPEHYRTAQAYTPDTHLLTTTWNQDAPYNDYLPDIGGTRVVAGCTSVAMAQIMRYHQHPASGRGVAAYDWNGTPLKSVLYRPYNWSIMPDALDAATPAYQRDAVGLLMRDLGIANHTDYGTDGSGAVIEVGALIANFGYADTIQSMDNTNTAFFSTIRSEIDAARPILLRFPGHITVADGYSSDLAGNKIHVNFGWGGIDDGYYFLDDTVDAGGFSFQPILEILYDIKPCSGNTCREDLEAEDGISGLTITGRFNYEYDQDDYLVDLKGVTTLSGDRGYSNQGFILGLYDSDNHPVAVSEKSLSLDLPAGRYRVQAALCFETSCWPPAEGFNDYTLAITTQPLTADEQADAAAVADKAPVIGNAFDDLFLAAGDPGPHTVLIDARDENGDALTLQVGNTNPTAVQSTLTGNLLTLSPTGAADTAATITVQATAGGAVTSRSLTVLLPAEALAAGRTIAVGGRFDSQAGLDKHKVILDGACTITGDRGYVDQSFFLSVRDADNNLLIAGTNMTISHTFAAGSYAIGASLTEGLTYYPYTPGDHDTYALAVSCPDADTRTETIAGLLGIDLSGTAPLPGDVNASGAVNLADAILVQQLMSGLLPAGTLAKAAAVDGDARIGIDDAVHALQHAAGLR